MLTVWMFTILLYGSQGQVMRAGAEPFKTQAECIDRLDKFMKDDPPGVPEQMGAVCIPVQFQGA